MAEARAESNVGGTAPGGGRPGVLVVAATEVAGDEILERIEGLATGRTVWVVAPSIAQNRLDHVAGNVDEGMHIAERRLESSLEALRRRGLDADGAIGDADPVLAISDSLAAHPADQVVIVTHPDEDAGWMEDDAFERARQRVEQPIVHLVADRESHLVQEERAGAGAEPTPDEEVETRSKNMPRLSAMDVAGILLALAGTIVLIVLASNSTDEAGRQGLFEAQDTAAVARLILAGAFALVNIAHVVGLLLFESVGYRGFWSRAFAYLSAIGTPLAVVVSLLIGD